METVKLSNNREYKIRFSYYPIGNNKVGLLWDTGCQIVDVKTDKVFCEGFAQQHPNDQFCKETGRKLSLTHALITKTKKRDPNYLKKRYKIEITANFAREERREFWRVYFARKNKKVTTT